MSLVELLNKKVKVFVYCTGAGAEFQNDIWKVPGCSSFFVGAGFPYANNSASKIIGYTPQKFVSEETSIELAAAAYMEAYQAKEADTENVIGIGLTASVASTKAHRGDHRIIVSVISNKGCHTYSCIIPKGAGASQREVDGAIANYVLQNCLLIEAGVKSLSDCLLIFQEKYFENNDLAVKTIMTHPVFSNDGLRFDKINSEKFVLYPGTFNPLHEGHLDFAARVQSRLKASVWSADYEVMFCTCINPKHKPPITINKMLDLVCQMQGKNFMFTHDDALYIEKVKKYPNTAFMIGADALLTMLDPKWTPDVKILLDELDGYDSLFYVMGRLVGDTFLSLEDIEEKFPILKEYCSLFLGINGRHDISSTEIRNKS